MAEGVPLRSLPPPGGGTPWAYLLSFVPFLALWWGSGVFPVDLRSYAAAIVGGLLIAEGVRRLVRRADELALLQERDALTGLFNRRRFQEDLPVEVTRARRFGTPLSLAHIDVEHFKALNEKYGHAEGDVVLQEIARVIDGSVRKNVDRCYRVGGDEFAVLLLGAKAEAAIIVMGGMRKGEQEVSRLGRYGVTWALGVAELEPDETPEVFLRRAERLARRALIPPERARRGAAQARSR